MKKKLALILSIFMLVAALLPLQTFAAKDMGLQNAITTAKTLFGITEDYEFDYSSSTYNGRTVWYLHWYKANDGGGVSVQIDDRGTVMVYDSYKDYDFSQRKLPKVTKEDALTKAKEFIKKVNNKTKPDILGELKLDVTGMSYLNDPYYYFNFVRVYGEIPFPDNRVTVSVNKQTGEINNYYYNWTEDIKFPDAKGKISLDEAQKAYQDNLGLKLIYKNNYDRKNMKVYLAYVPVFNSFVCIDALTGEKLELNPMYTGGDGGGGPKDESASNSNDKESAPVTLSPEELKAVQEMTKLLSQDKAEAKARAIKEIELTKEYKLKRAGVSRNWMLQKEFVWNLEFEKIVSLEKGERYYVSVALDGVTGELESFYRYYDSVGMEEVKYNKDEAKKSVEEFLKKVIKEKFENLQYEENTRNEIFAVDEAPMFYNFRYTRLVDGVPYVDNSVSVGFDAVTGKIRYFSINWFDLEFPAKDKVLTMDKAYESLFDKLGLSLEYKLKGPQEIYTKSGVMENPEPEVVLVYILNQNKPNQLDANTGEILNYDGMVYNEEKPASYSDIDGHFAEKEITELAEFGIGFPGTEFRPNEAIQQKEFLSLISKVLDYYGPVISNESPEDEINRMYAYLIRAGVVKETEKNPAVTVSREESMKFIIRALKYDKVAELPGIFTCKFADVTEITPAMLGYVTIGHALNLVNGDSQNKFNPKREMARGEAALIIHRMLKIE